MSSPEDSHVLSKLTVPCASHETQNGQYSVGNYCVANALVQAPFVFLMAVCCSTPVYWITDMNDDSWRWEALPAWCGKERGLA